MAISGKKESKEEIKQRYEKVSAYLNSTVSHPEAFIGRYEKMSEGLDDINKNLYNGIAGNIVALNSKMISVRPISGNANYTKGGRNLTTTQMAHYLDSVDAMINPHKILGMIEARTISPEMLALFKQFNPEIWNALRSEVGAKIQQQAASGEASQVSPVVGSYFGIPVAPQMNPYSSLYKPETQPQAQGQAQGQPQQAQPLSRPSGVDKFINKDFYNRDLNLNK
jgi:hypothetical protein